MVHRIQNRNPGYSDFTTSTGTTPHNFSNTSSNPVSHGANALKLENELVNENINSQTVDEINNQYHEELLKDQEAKSIVESTSDDEEKSFSQEAISNETEHNITNDLKEFGVDTDEPDLFNSNTHTSNSDDLLRSSEE